MRPRTEAKAPKTPPAWLEKHFGEIVVGSGRSQEPYVIAFHYASDNISGSPLGTLFGFFEVEIHDQDAAYIVNFLASVAKKEYFANSKRSPMESFETALHKINVALAEIVKHGNVSWLGHLHGALGTISQDTLHFSVTGEGEIFLAREEDFHSISAGLADNDSEPHPLKTFTEISSGDLLDGDQIFAISPSVWSLFSPEDLRRSLNRLGPGGFEQFLRTALVNELPVAAVSCVTCTAPIEIQKPAPAPAKPATDLSNVWSDKPFIASAKSSKSQPTTQIDDAEATEEHEEYTDKKTGHIYVQAAPDSSPATAPSPWEERWVMFSHDVENRIRNWNIALKKYGRRTGKESAIFLQAVSARGAAGKRSLHRRARGMKRVLQSRYQQFQEKRLSAAERKRALRILEAEASPVPPVIAEEPTPVTAVPPTPVQTGRLARFAMSAHLTSFDQLPRSLMATWGERGRALASRMTLSVTRLTRQFFTDTRVRWQSLSAKQKRVTLGALGALAIITLVGTIANVRTNTDVPTTKVPQSETPSQTALPTAFPPADEPLATLLSGNRLMFPTNNSRTVAVANINATTFLTTERAITNLKTQESTSAPENLRLAAAMDDLDAIFAIGESGTLYLYSIVTKKFTTNTLPLPAGTTIDALGAYLTYIYVLDEKSGAVYRFPRAEGGFGPPTTWSKESLALAEDSAFSVYENIVLTGITGEPLLYSRGRKANINFSGTKNTTRTDAAAFDTQSGDVLVLDRANKRIIRWSATGTLVAQYFHESFGDIETFAVSPDGTELFTSRQGAVTAWRM